MNPDPLWYFAYGSNLDPRTFLGRRGMQPLATRNVQLSDYRLVFDLAIGSGERGVANLLAEPGSTVLGVAYQISDGQAQRLDRTEGVPKSYRRTAVELVADDLAERLSGFTYVSPHRKMGRKPSERYMGLLLHGARHHGLPDFYVEYLRNFELAVDERATQMELFGAPERSR